MPQQYVYAGLALVGIFLLTYIGFSSGSMLLLAAMIGVPIGIYLVNHPVAWFTFVVALSSSRIRVPGLPDRLSLFDAMAFGLVILLGATYIIRRHDKPAERSWSRTMLWLFAIVIVMTMAYRGVGLRALGSHQWGGTFYIYLLTGIALMLLVYLIRIPRQIWIIAFFGMIFLSFLPLFAQLAFHFSAGRMGWIYNFVQPTGFLVESLQSQMSGEGVERFNSGSLVALLAIPFVLFNRPFHGWPFFLTLLICLIALPLVALSGSRHSTILALLFLLCWSAFHPRKFEWVLPTVLVSISLLSLLLLAQIAYMFPEPVQRALTFVPGAKTSFIVGADAQGTIDWRIYLWKRSLVSLWENPQWLGIGQGIAYDPSGFEGLELEGTYSAEWAFVCKAYHHGALSLLMIFGIPGLILGQGILFTSIWRHYKAMRTEPCDDEWMNRMYRVVLAMFIARIILFTLISGGVQYFLSELFFLGALLEGIKTARAMRPLDAPDAPVFQSPIPAGYAISS